MKKSDVDELPLLALSDLELSRSEKKGPGLVLEELMKVLVLRQERDSKPPEVFFSPGNNCRPGRMLAAAPVASGCSSRINWSV